MVSTPAKIGIAGGTLVVGVGGGVGIWGLSARSNTDSINQKDEYENNTIRKRYDSYFLSSKDNKEEWDRRFNQYKNHFSSYDVNGLGKFKGVNKGYSESESTALNKVCEEAYKETDSRKFVDPFGEDGNTTSVTKDQFKVDGVWDYCGRSEVEVVGFDRENEVGADTIGSKYINSSVLVWIDSKNNWFWEIRNKEFWSNEGVRSKEKVQGEGSKFANLKTKSSGSVKDLKEACKEIYKKQESEDSDGKHKADALLFCSIKLDLVGSRT